MCSSAACCYSHPRKDLLSGDAGLCLGANLLFVNVHRPRLCFQAIPICVVAVNKIINDPYWHQYLNFLAVVPELWKKNIVAQELLVCRDTLCTEAHWTTRGSLTALLCAAKLWCAVSHSKKHFFILLFSVFLSHLVSVWLGMLVVPGENYSPPLKVLRLFWIRILKSVVSFVYEWILRIPGPLSKL